VTEEIRIPNGDADGDDFSEESSAKSSINSEEVIRKKSVSFAQQELRTSLSADSISSQMSAPAVVTATAPIPSKNAFSLS
jgi:hypothetical protein